jgi:TonB family protein
VQSTRQDGFSAASHAGTKAPRNNVLDVVILTTDSRLLATLQEACGSEHAIHHVETAEAAVELLIGGRCGIFIADLGTLHGNAAPLLLKLNAQFPELILMATGRREEEASVTPLVSNGRVYRFLHKPISPPRAQLFIGAATRRYQEMQAFEPIALATVRTVRTMAARSPIRRYAGGAVALIALLAGLSLWDSSEKHVIAPSMQLKTTTASSQEQIADYLARANIALATGRLADPKGDNALEYYQHVLALQPDDSDARAGVRRTLDVLAKRIDNEIAAKNSHGAAISLAQLQRAQPNHPRIAELRSALAALQRARVVAINETPAPVDNPAPASEISPSADAPAEPQHSADLSSADLTPAAPSEPVATPAASPADEAVITEELAIATRMRERGVLLDPAGENAYERILELRERNPNSDAIRAEEQRLAFTLVENARTALAAKDLDTADRMLKAADTLVPGMNTVRSLQQQAASARTEAQANSIAQAALLPRRREIPATYPEAARRDGLEGWVDVEFTISPDGDTEDLVVRDAEPRDVFEKAAVDAVKHWKFEPIVKDGTTVSQRAILRVRFTMAN